MYYETIVQLLYLSGNHIPQVMIYTNKLVTLKNLILNYIGMTYINILKKVSCCEVIWKLWDVFFMKIIFIAP